MDKNVLFCEWSEQTIFALILDRENWNIRKATQTEEIVCNETFLDIFKHCDFCIAIEISILPPDIIDQFNSWTFKLFQF